MPDFDLRGPQRQIEAMERQLDALQKIVADLVTAAERSSANQARIVELLAYPPNIAPPRGDVDAGKP